MTIFRRTLGLPILLVWTIMAAIQSPTSTVTAQQQDEDAACTLNCPWDAPCVISEVTLPDTGQKQPQQHCACPPGWTGLLCQTKYESCSIRGNNEDRCYHGGKCVEEAFDDFGNPQLMCDCSTAMTTLVENEGGNDNGGGGGGTKQTVTKYVGKYCEHAMQQQCDTHNVDRFCVNGGDCNPNFETDGIACLCPTGYHGYHCEYEQAQVPVEQYCSLDCANGGTCILGLVNPSQAKDLERIWGSEDIVGIFDQMRCLCPPGFGGPLCQARQETCGEGYENDDNAYSGTTVPSHFCYHGGQCVTTTTIINTFHGDESKGQPSYHCDCTTALDDQGNRFTGDYCQVQSTIFCDNTDPSFFCTHGGVCPRFSHQPCVCPEGFEGHKCEYATTTPAPTPTVSINPHADAASSVPVRCGDIVCLHGSTCSTREGSNGLEEYCDCSGTYRPDLYQAFAGEACQYQATTFCPTPQEEEGNGDPTFADLSFCVHHGTCLQTSDADGSQCTCPDGWAGPHCEFEASLDPNEETSLPACGDTVCYHGGKCVQTSVTTQQGDDESTTQVVEHYCDCSRAYDDEFLYSGKSCEYPSTSICDESLSSEPGNFFCANHGICLFKNLQQGCICRAGFSGLHCEYLDVEANDDEAANLAGSQEPLVNQCDDSSYCRNGGTCLTTPVKHNGHIQYVSHCDCSTTATNNTIFAGPHCEHAATSYCTDPFDGDSTGSGKVVTSTLFCVQGGTCRDNVFEGCDCPVGWTGLRCEYPIDVQELVDDEDDDNNVPPPTPCGDNVCYHGGICVTSEQEDPVSGDLQDLFSCDCSTTVTTLVDGTIEIYGGPTCSTKSTSVCQAATADDPSALLVCMNHGTCRDDPTKGCDCPSGFTGTICDIEVEDDSHKDQGVPCGDFYCYHGGTCDSVRITDPDGKVTLMDYCDCFPAVDDDHLYAGSSCQYKSTSFCTHPTQGLSLEGTRFCVNGGTCKQSGDATAGFEQGCDCPPGWTGFSCEIPQDPQDALDDVLVVDHEVCGENVCLNGGTCVTTRIFGANGTASSVQYCDCNMAHDEDHLFAGPNCEYPSSTLCANPDLDAANLLGTPFCVNGGTCHKDHVLGECSCPSHWVGFRCEFPADEVPTDNSEICSDDDDGQFVCQHGGRCVGTGCDCESAIEGTMRYDGLYCQYPATEYCDDPLEQSSTTLSIVDFCVNGGKCQEGQGCACPTGHYGPRCEMTKYAEDTPAMDRTPDNDDEVDTNSPVEYNCRLSCSNGGSCVKGAKDGSHGVYGQAIGQVAHLNMTFDETLFEHCVCPPGFIGLLCEHVVETCDGASAGGKSGDHYCFHGSKCVYDSSGKPYCDCDDAQARIDGQLETVFGGSSCQHRASDICITDDGDEDPSDNKSNMFLTRPLYFCVNQGQCREYVTIDDPDPGCDCPSEWLGPHCEIYQGVESQLGSSLFDDDEFSDDTEERRTGLLVWTTLLLIMALVYLLVRARRLSRESMDPSPTKPEEEDGMHDEGEAGTGVVGATDHWSSAIRNCFLVRRTMGRDDGVPPIPSSSSSSVWSSASSVSVSVAATKGLPQDLLKGNINLAPTHRSTFMYEDEVVVKRNTGLSPPSSSLSPLSDPDDDRQLFVDDETAEGGGGVMDIEII